MEIEERVLVKNSHQRSNLYTMFVHASHGDYVDVVKGKDAQAIAKLERTLQDEFDEFAQRCFDRGREYERKRAK